MKKINVITLGCSKNTVDSEHLMARLAAAGYEVLFDSDRTDAKVVVINTCGFIGDAKQESIDMILRAAEAKKAGKISRLFVVGCLSERYADELRAEIPEVDDYFGARTWDGIVRALGASEDPALATERRLTTPKHYAYLKISEGCNWKCGYCAIPLIRGAHVSVPMEELEEEARKLAGQGVRELMNLTWHELQQLPPVFVYEPEFVETEAAPVTENDWTIERDGDAYVVTGAWVDKVMGSVNLDDYESRQYMDRMLQTAGIYAKLEEMGIEENAPVIIGELEFEYVY